MEDNLDSHVTFKMNSTLTGADYMKFITDLLEQFLLWADPKINPVWAKQLACENRWNEESSVDMFRVNEASIGHIKLYLYDENGGNYPYLSRTIVFRDHYDSPAIVEKVHLVSDKFEEFLKFRNLGYTRRNRTR